MEIAKFDTMTCANNTTVNRIQRQHVTLHGAICIYLVSMEN